MLAPSKSLIEIYIDLISDNGLYLNELNKYSKAIPDLISSNEKLEDVSTSALLYVPVNSFYASSIYQQQFSSTDERLKQLESCINALNSFYLLVFQLDLVSDGVFDKLNDLSKPVDPSSPPTFPRVSREEKIKQHKMKKEIKEKLQVYFENVGKREFDEEDLRAFHILLIKDSIRNAYETLESLSVEYKMLKCGPLNYCSPDRSMIDPNQKPASLLDKSGKVLQPFVITSRTKTMDGVFRPGHRLPTMTIDEYLEREKERGNIITGGGNAGQGKKENDDDEDDEQGIYKKREWDDYKDDNPRGWGNMKGNRG